METKLTHIDKVSAVFRDSSTLTDNHTESEYTTESYRGGLSHHKLKRIEDYIDAHLQLNIGVEELAKIAGLSTYHFSRTFKQSVGMSPHQYLIYKRVERAKHLLKQSDMRICEIAVACGFAHQSHFYRHFKKLTGTTPKALRDL